MISSAVDDHKSTECFICANDQKKFMDCSECVNKICTDCFSNLRKLECPYCRASYNKFYGTSSVNDFEDDDGNFLPIIDDLKLEFIPVDDIEPSDLRGMPFGNFTEGLRYFRDNERLPNVELVEEFGDEVRRRNNLTIQNLLHANISNFLEGNIEMSGMIDLLAAARRLYQLT